VWLKFASSSSYIVSTSIANKVKAKFYDVDIPALENVSEGCAPPT
jgi:hypothetical protein